MDAPRRLKLLDKPHLPTREAVMGALEMIALQSGWDSLYEMKAAVLKERARHERHTVQPTG